MAKACKADVAKRHRRFALKYQNVVNPRRILTWLAFEEQLIRRVAEDDVGAVGAVEAVARGIVACGEDIVAAAAGEAIGATFAVERVVAGAAVDRVAAVAA